MASTSRLRRLSLATLVACMASTVTAHAATYRVGSFTVSISDAIPANEKIRGAIATSRWSPMVMESTGKSDFDKFVVDERLAVISSGFSDGNLSLSGYVSEYNALVNAFNTIADQAGRPELKHVGFIFQGCSIHGARSMSQGFGNPDRTIAAISFCGRNYALFSLLPNFSAFMPELSFPHLQVTNGNDGDRVGWNDDTTRQVRDEARGLWSASLHPKLGHCDAAQDGIKFELLWLREVLKARVPSPIPSGAYSLNELTDDKGWLGDYTPARGDGSIWGGGYKFTNARVFAASSVAANQVKNYIWFPTRVAAEEWKQYSDTGTCCRNMSFPEEPGEEPGEGPGEEPGEGPVDPGEEPGEEPGETPEEPGEEPGETPEEPGEEPGESPEEPGEEPGATPEEPGEDPDGSTDPRPRICAAGDASWLVALASLLMGRRRKRKLP